MQFGLFCAIKALFKSIQALFGPEIFGPAAVSIDLTLFPKPTCRPEAANCCSCAAVRMVVARLGAGEVARPGGGSEGRQDINCYKIFV